MVIKYAFYYKLQIAFQAHVHHYTQVHGFEESHFIESKENILSLCECYAEIQNMEETSISRLQVI